MSRSDQNRRESFILYFSDGILLNVLNDEEVGIITKNIFHHVLGEEETEIQDRMVKAVYDSIINHIDRDTQKYLEKCKKNKDNADARWGNQKS